MTDTERRIVDALAAGSVTLTDLAWLAGLSAFVVAGLVPVLERRGIVARHGWDRITLVSVPHEAAA
jgi:hypothetical protein